VGADQAHEGKASPLSGMPIWGPAKAMRLRSHTRHGKGPAHKGLSRASQRVTEAEPAK